MVSLLEPQPTSVQDDADADGKAFNLFKATYNKNTETRRGKGPASRQKANDSCSEVRAGKWAAPFSLCSVFSLCFSERVGAMVIGAIEIDGAHHPARGCQAVPMAMR